MATTLSLIVKADKTRKFFWLFLSRITPLVVLFLITIVYSRELTYDDYGKFQSVWMYTNIINVIISFGITSVILSTDLDFLIAFIRNKWRTLSVFYTCLGISALTTFFFIAKNFDVSLKLLLILFMILQNIGTVADNLLIKSDKVKISGVINVFYALLFLGWHIYILTSGYSLFHLVAGITILSAIRLALITLFISQKKEINAIVDDRKFLFHWGFLGMNDALGVMAKWIDKLFLIYLLTAGEFAVFFNGSIEIPLFALLVSVTGNFLSIEISANLEQPQKIINLYRESFHILSSIVFPLFLFLFFFRADLFSFVFDGKYNTSLPIFAISIFILPLRINSYSVILQCHSQGKRVLFGSLLDLSIALTLMIILYPLIGSRGVALSVVISTYCQSYYYLWHSSKLLNTSILNLLPIKKLGIRFFKILIFYLALSLILSGLSVPLRLLAIIVITTAIVVLGLIKYFKTYFNAR